MGLAIRSTVASAFALLLAACSGGGAEPSAAKGTTHGTGGGAGVGGAGGAGGAGGMAPTCALDAGWAMPENPPTSVDTDGDGYDDCQEAACGSNPMDPASKCYKCGWRHDDPGTLVSTGAKVGDVIENLDLIDQCLEHVKLWDFAGKYHILFMTAAW